MGSYRESTDPIISFSTFWGRRNTPLVNTLISYNSTLFIFLCFTSNPFGFHHEVPLIKAIFGSSVILEGLSVYFSQCILFSAGQQSKIKLNKMPFSFFLFLKKSISGC